MKKSKKIFFILSLIFILIMLYIAYDINKRTTWPGSDINLKERITKELDK